MLALMLLVGFLSNIVPLASVSAGSRCTLECCAGKPPHAAGSCMDGACEAHLLTHSAAKRKQVKRDLDDQFCGVSHAVRLKNLARMRPNRAPRQVGSYQPRASAAAFVKPCQADCGGSAAGFGNSNRNSAVIADRVRPRDPTAIHLSDFGRHRTQLLDALCRQCAPRGPPFSFS